MGRLVGTISLIPTGFTLVEHLPQDQTHLDLRPCPPSKGRFSTNLKGVSSGSQRASGQDRLSVSNSFYLPLQPESEQVKEYQNRISWGGGQRKEEEKRFTF